MEKEYTGRVRALKILFLIVQSPFRYTIKRLAQKYEVNESTIKRDFEAFKEAGFNVVYNEHYRYGLNVERQYDNLKELLVFSKKEEDTLMTALQQMGTENKTVEKLKKKFSRLYDASKMSNVFDKNFLSKMDLLEKAKTDKKVVTLKDYHSTNSSTVRDRTVEVFNISAEDDIIHAFDLEAVNKKDSIRHFRISRVYKLNITTTGWANEASHQIQPTDCFRIHDNKQVSVHLRLKVGAYNQLLEQFPMARQWLKPTSETENMYDFQCKVNHQFFGLINFILGNYQNIEAIYEPQSLIERIEQEAKQLLAKKF